MEEKALEIRPPPAGFWFGIFKIESKYNGNEKECYFGYLEKVGRAPNWPNTCRLALKDK